MATKIFVIQGANLNLLGTREPEIYGNTTLDELHQHLKNKFTAIDFSFFQSNDESEIIDCLHQANEKAQAVIINAGGFSHTSIAIADAVASIKIPSIVVHISNIYNREKYREHDVVGEKCVGAIVGLGIAGYQLAVECLCDDFIFKKSTIVIL